MAETRVVYRTKLAFHITTTIMLHAFLLFTQTQSNKDIYSIRVVISGYQFSDRYQRYIKKYIIHRGTSRGCHFVKEVTQWSFITVTDPLSSWVSFYLQKLNLNKNICCTKVRLPALILWIGLRLSVMNFSLFIVLQPYLGHLIALSYSIFSAFS